MRRLCCAALVLAACKGELHDLGQDPTPLAVIRGHIRGDITGTLLDEIRALGRLRVGILWAAVPVFVPYCHARGPTPLDPRRRISAVARDGCRDPFDVVPALAGPSVALAPGSSEFALPLTQLPSAEVLVGERGQRVAYGSIVLFDDSDGDAELDLRGGCSSFGGGPPPREGEGDGRNAGNAIYAASFHTLKIKQVRLAYVEGPFDAGSHFYPHPSCSALPTGGFSLWHVGNLLDDAGDCRVLPIDAPVELTLAPSGEFGSLSCAQRDRESFSRPPSQRFLEDEASFRELLTQFRWECFGDQLALVDSDCACPVVRVFGVKGCWDEVVEECTVPDWDLTETLASKGIEWPCQARP